MKQPARAFPALAAYVLCAAGAAHANGVGENQTWQFLSGADKTTRAAATDLMERKRAGYYDSFQTVNHITNNTAIERQVNCSVSATSAGNGGSNGMSAATSSPGVSNNSTTSAASSANSASNGLGPSAGGWPGGAGGGQLGNTQSSTGTLTSGISGSATSAVTGAVSAGGGRSDQVLNSSQSNQGQQVARIMGSTACAGPLN